VLWHSLLFLWEEDTKQVAAHFARTRQYVFGQCAEGLKHSHNVKQGIYFSPFLTKKKPPIISEESFSSNSVQSKICATKYITSTATPYLQRKPTDLPGIVEFVFLE
jgi:hypothetical protein